MRVSTFTIILFFVCTSAKKTVTFGEVTTTEMLNNLKINTSYVCDSSIEQLSTTSKIELFDSSAKIPNGILNLNLYDLGSFDECMDLYENISQDVYGKYCMGTMAVELDPEVFKTLLEKHSKLTTESTSVTFHLGYCLLNSCSLEDFQRLLPWMTFTDNFCYTKSKGRSFDAVDITAICIYSIIGGLVTFSTIYDLYLYHQKKKPKHNIFTAFSLWTNGKKIFETKSNPDQLSCLNGIKAISIIWIIYGHVHLYLFYFAFDNMKDMAVFSKNKKNMYLMSASLTVDSFFAIGGILTVYTFLKSNDRGVRLNVPLMYFHRYLRLTPALAAMVLFHASLFRYTGNGPLWGSVDALIQPCRTYWWSTLLYVQNYVNLNNMCTGQSWYLSADMQIFVLTPIILVPLARWPKYGLFALVALVFCGIAIPFGITYGLDLQTSMAADDRGDDMFPYMDYYYLQAYARFGPYTIGMIFGYIIYHKKLKKNDTEKIGKRKLMLIFSLWLISLGILLACTYGNADMFTGLTKDIVSRSFHNGLNRNAWSFAICLVISLCSLGYGGIINDFLSLSLFQLLAKLSYSMYLVHITVIEIRLMNNKIVEHFTERDVVNAFWGDLINTIIVSFFLCSIFESPIIAIESILFDKHRNLLPNK